MKLVIAIIKPSRLEEVRQALNSLDVHGMTVTEVKGYGRQKGHSEIYRGTEYAVHFLPKLKIEIAVDDAQSDAIVSAIRESAQTGRIGDGKIFVSSIDDAIRIRTGERGDAAVAEEERLQHEADGDRRKRGPTKQHAAERREHEVDGRGAERDVNE